MENYGQNAVSESFMELKRRFGDFLEHQPGADEPYKERIEALFEDKPKGDVKNARLLVDVHDLQAFDADLHKRLLTDPCECMRPFEDALRDAARNLDGGQFGQKNQTAIDVRTKRIFALYSMLVNVMPRPTTQIQGWPGMRTF